MREDVMNSVINRFNVSKLEVNFSIDREGEHQMDCYTVYPHVTSQEPVLYAPKLIGTWMANGGSTDKAIKDII